MIFWLDINELKCFDVILSFYYKWKSGILCVVLQIVVTQVVKPINVTMYKLRFIIRPELIYI